MKLLPISFFAIAALALSLGSCKKEETSFILDENGETYVPGAKHDDSNAPPEVDYADLGYENDGSFSLNGVPFTGIAVQNHNDGTKKARYSMVDGQFDGLVEEWYENGIRSTFKKYKAGLRHGITTYWNEAGVPTKQVMYHEDEEKKVIDDPEILKKLPIASEKGIR